MNLSNKGMLVNLSVSDWTGKKIDRKATNTVENTHNTQGNVGNYTKQLLPGATELKTVHQLTAKLRKYFHEYTLPWYGDGTRILSSKLYLEFTNGYRMIKDSRDHAVKSFLSEYQNLVDASRRSLGELFREEDYPTTQELEHAFACDIAFMPIPAIEDFRVELADSEKASFIERMKQVESDATKDCWNRLYQVVNKAAETLSKPDAIFRDSLIENVQAICAVLPKLNITDDVNLETMRKQVESVVSTLSPDQLRDSQWDRDNASKQLDDITSKMSIFMGG